MRDRWVGAVTCALGVVMLVATRRLPEAMLGNPAGPSLLPRILSCALIGLGALLALRPPPHTNLGPIWGGGWRLAAAVGLLFAYAFVLTPLGYLLATTLVLFLLLLIYNPQRHVLNAFVAVSFSVLTYGLFHKLLGVYVPKGLVG